MTSPAVDRLVESLQDLPRRSPSEQLERIEHVCLAVRRFASNGSPIDKDEVVSGIREQAMRVPDLWSSNLEELCGIWLDGEAEQLDELLFARDGASVTNHWPDPLDEAAYHGLAGDFVRTVDPHTGSDLVGMLAQFLVAFGSCVGRGAYFPVEADRHFTNEFFLTVGDSTRGRKGTAC